MQRELKVTNILINGWFACIGGDLVELKINLNVCSNDDHMVEIERLNITVKERVRGIYKTIPLKKIPGRIIVELVALVIFCLNSIPPSPSLGGGSARTR